jgi:hypothetical protein
MMLVSSIPNLIVQASLPIREGLPDGYENISPEPRMDPFLLRPAAEARR